MTNPLVPNFTKGVGKLVTDRGLFAEHVDGYAQRHDATDIDLNPHITFESVTYTTVQEALDVFAVNIPPPPPAQATKGTGTGNLGIITLGGDLGGTSSTALIPTVSGLQGYPVNIPSTPTTNYVLTWTGSTWSPQAIPAFMAGGDLGGTNTSQQVIGLTGNTTTNVGFHTVLSAADFLEFIPTAIPTITQQPYVNSGAITNTAALMTISSQSVSNTGHSGNGGRIVISSGDAYNAASDSVIRGDIKISTGNLATTGKTGIQLTEITPSNFVTALFPSNGTHITTSDMPTNTGSGVIYLGNAITAPVVAATTGTILWSSAGQLNVMQENGVSFVVGNSPNPNVFLSGAVYDVMTFSTVALVSGTFDISAFNEATIGAGITAIQITLTPSKSMKLSIVYVGKEIGSTDTNSAQYTYNIGYTVSSLGAQATIGSFTASDSRTAGGSWNVPLTPNLITSGSNLIVSIGTGYSSAASSFWTVTAHGTVTSA